MKVTELMSSNVISVEMGDPLSKVKSIFEEKGFHHLLVVENNYLYGIISDRDLLKAISPNVNSKSANIKDLATLNKKAHQIMTRKPICLNENAKIKDAIKLFDENKISCIPIVNEENEAVGILTWRDIIRLLARGDEA